MQKRQHSVKAVIFDMDGVITNTMPDHLKSWQSVFNASGFKVDHYEIYRREGQPGIETLREIFKEHGRPFQLKRAKEMLAAKEMLFKKIVRRRFISGSRRFLKMLKQKGFALGLVTGTSAHEVREILPKQIYDFFSVVITGSDVKKGKPHPEPYLRALRAMSLNKNDAIVLENAPFGIRSAKSAGVECWALETSLPRKYLSEADYVFSSFNDLLTRTSLQYKYE